MSDAHHIFLVPGFFGFSNLGRLRYFAHVREFLVQRSAAAGLRASVHVVKTHPTASLPKRSARLAETIARNAGGRGSVHVIGHSSGGLDARLLAAPGVRLPTSVDLEGFARRTRTVVTVATPHHGTPMASFFNGLLGQKLLRVVSLSTIYVLRFGRLPLSAVLQVGAIFSRLDNLAVNSALLDQLFDSLLDDFSIGRRRAVRRLFSEVSSDQGLLLQLTPEGMDLFNASVRDRPGVRYGCVITRSERPGIGSTWRTGLDPSGQATHALYRALYRLASGTPRAWSPPLSAPEGRLLRHVFGSLPNARSNDGIVPTRSQVWGTIIHATRADHLDVVGHFTDPSHVPPHYDWIATGSGFTRRKFEAVWEDVLSFVAGEG